MFDYSSVILLFAAIYWYLTKKRRDEEGKLWIFSFVQALDVLVYDHLKWQMHTNVFQNDYIDLVTGRSLVWLLGFDANKKMMTDIFLSIYQQKETDKVIKSFLEVTIGDYLKTKHCT